MPQFRSVVNIDLGKEEHMESHWMISEIGKLRHEDMLRQAVSARRFLTAKRSRELPALWRFVILLLS